MGQYLWDCPTLLWAWTTVMVTSTVWGCGDEPANIEPNLASIQLNVFDKSCSQTSCHSAAGRRGNLILEADQARAQLVGVPADNDAAANQSLVRVVPGQPDASFLMLNITRPVASEYGELMPEGSGQGLSSEKLAAIRQWIRDGAP